MNMEEGHKVVRCHGEDALDRAKSLVNIQFSWYVIGVTVFAMIVYLVMIKFYDHERVEYQSLSKFVLQDEKNEDEDDEDDVEAQKKANNTKVEEAKSFLQIGKSFASMDVER